MRSKTEILRQINQLNPLLKRTDLENSYPPEQSTISLSIKSDCDNVTTRTLFCFNYFRILADILQRYYE